MDSRQRYTTKHRSLNDIDSGQFTYTGPYYHVTDLEIRQVVKDSNLEWPGPRLGCLGEGAFGRVIKVKHLTDNHEYAVKLMRRTFDQDILKYQTRELRLLTEQVASPMTHKNIVKYYHSWELFDIRCIRMELCGKNLEDLLQEKKSVVDNAIFYQHVFPQILSGLEFLHDKIHWVHRDIYPPNILMAIPEQGLPDSVVHVSSLVVKIADFGLARKLDEDDQLNLSEPPSEILSVVGNRLYQAPEMSTGIYDYKVDLYSAGIVLYRLCCYSEPKCYIVGELERLRMNGNKIDKNKLCHNNEFLHQLLLDLLNEDPKKRPSASEAQTRFFCPSSPALQGTQATGSLAETDGLKQPSQVKVLAKRSSDSHYVRIYDMYRSDGSFEKLHKSLMEGLEISGSDIESVIEEKCNEKVRNDRDWNAILQSAEKNESVVNLVVVQGSDEIPDLC